MKKILVVFVMLGYSCFAQKTIPNSFILKNVPGGNELLYKEVIEGADMEKYRLQSEDLTLLFENGAQCTLLSAKSLFMKGININPTAYATSVNKNILPVFTVLPDKKLAARVPNIIDNKRFSQ